MAIYYQGNDIDTIYLKRKEYYIMTALELIYNIFYPSYTELAIAIVDFMEEIPEGSYSELIHTLQLSAIIDGNAEALLDLGEEAIGTALQHGTNLNVASFLQYVISELDIEQVAQIVEEYGVA